MNETFIAIYLHSLSALSDFNDSQLEREEIGKIPIIAIFLNLSVNLIKFFVHLCSDIKEWRRARRLKKY